MNKKKLRKTGMGLLCSALAVTGAFAFLKNTETATKTNTIKPGRTSLMFRNQQNTVTLADNTAIPMTKEYAIENLVPYTFDIMNEGTIEMNYTISVSSTGYSNSFPENKVNVIIAPIADDATDDDIKAALRSATVQRVSVGANLIDSYSQAGRSKRYALLAYIDKTTTLAEYTGNSAAFRLEVSGTQRTAITSESYNALEKSQIATSITAGGETKNVEVYNIEGDSKTDLLNKLTASGLADGANVDAIVEVCGDDYDGMNSTATFDVSSIANPGDKVIILHYNEETQEWEFIGEEVVGEDNTVTGNFTSYSPVAFVVNTSNGYIQKIYDSETKMLVQTIWFRTDGSRVITDYDATGDISNQEVVGSTTPAEAENVGPLYALIGGYMRNADSTYLDDEASKTFMIENVEGFEPNNFRLYGGNVYDFTFVNVDTSEALSETWHFTTPAERTVITIERLNEEGVRENAGTAWGFFDDELPGTTNGQRFSDAVVGEEVNLYGGHQTFYCTGIYKATGTLNTSGENFYHMVDLELKLMDEAEYTNNINAGHITAEKAFLYEGRAYKYEVEGLTFYAKTVKTYVIVGEDASGNHTLSIFDRDRSNSYPVGSTMGSNTVIFSAWVDGTEVRHQ